MNIIGEDWFDYPEFEGQVKFNRKGNFIRLKNHKWIPIKPKFGDRRGFIKTHVDSRQLYFIVSIFIYEFFSQEILTPDFEIVHLDKDVTNCGYDNLMKLSILEARDWVNRDNTEHKLENFVRDYLPDFSIKNIIWDYFIKSTNSTDRKGNPSQRHAIFYDKTKILLYNNVLKVGDWISYRTLISNRHKLFQQETVTNYINKIFEDRNLVPFPSDYDTKRIYETPEGYFNVYVDHQNKLFLIRELCLRENKYTPTQIVITKIDDYTDELFISPFKIIEKITGVNLRKDVHTIWFPSVVEKTLTDIFDEKKIMPTFTQLRYTNSALHHFLTKNGGKSEYFELCKKYKLDVPFCFLDENLKDFDSEDEFRIFCTLKENGINFTRQVLYPDDSKRTLDFDLYELGLKLEFTSRVTNEASLGIDNKIIDAKKFGWNLIVMEYYERESPDDFVNRLSELIGVRLSVPEWKNYYEKYGYGTTKFKSEIRKFLKENYPKIYLAGELRSLNPFFMKWAKKFWGHYVNTLFQNGIKIQHSTPIPPDFLHQNLDKILKTIIRDEGYLPYYHDIKQKNRVSQQTKLFVHAIYKFYGEDYYEPWGEIHKKYKKHFKIKKIYKLSLPSNG